MGQQQRQRVGALALRHHDVHGLPPDYRTELT